MKLVKITDVKPNPKNPRIIKDGKFQKLVKSIQEFPDMLNKRPLIVFTDVDNKYCVLGGNMRLKALNELKFKEIPVIIADEWTEEQKAEFLIKDNVGFGEWDWDSLANEWDADKLDDWGLDIPNFNINDNEDIIDEVDIKDLFDIELPFYTPSQEVPQYYEMANQEKSDELIKEIELLNIDTELKQILIKRASFFTDFNFNKIADYYVKQNSEIKLIFEKLGMVVIAPRKAVELGFIDLKENIEDL